jgi:alkylation response protein AidB-like acyl-CoA dehydrogenase
MGAMGLTEPNAGSDAAGLETTAVRKGDKYVLNGTKMFITNGPIADVLVVYATVDKSLKHQGVTGFIVEKDYPGYSVGKELNKMCVRSSTTGELVFDDCEVPVENRLGDEGAGFMMALGTVEWDRSALLAPSVGATEYILEQCVRYAKPPSVRAAHLLVPRDQAHVGRYEDLHRSGPYADLPDRLEEGSGCGSEPSGSLYHQALCLRLGHEGG